MLFQAYEEKSVKFEVLAPGTPRVAISNVGDKWATLHIEGREPQRVDVQEIEAAAQQSDPMLREFYAAAWARIEPQVAAAKQTALVKQQRETLSRRKECGHVRVKTVDYGFTGPVSKNENRAAHGGICEVATCEHCGAEKSVNVNGWHVEEGEWDLLVGLDLL